MLHCYVCFLENDTLIKKIFFFVLNDIYSLSEFFSHEYIEQVQNI